jgi:hypothetical protein
MNGAAIATTPSRIAGRGLRRMSPSAARALPLDEHYREEPHSPYRRLGKGDLHRREVLQRVLDEH